MWNVKGRAVTTKENEEYLYAWHKTPRKTHIHIPTVQSAAEYISYIVGKVEDKLLKSCRQTWLPWSVVLTELGGSEVDYCWGWTDTVWHCRGALRSSMNFTLLSEWCDGEWKAFQEHGLRCRGENVGLYWALLETQWLRKRHITIHPMNQGLNKFQTDYILAKETFI